MAFWENTSSVIGTHNTHTLHILQIQPTGQMVLTKKKNKSENETQNIER